MSARPETPIETYARIAGLPLPACGDLHALAAQLDSEASIADRPGQLDRLEAIAAQLRAHRCTPGDPR